MTVKELIEELQKLDPKRGVILSSDEEEEPYVDEENYPIDDDNDYEAPGKAVILWP
jgi:hypothetical protein